MAFMILDFVPLPPNGHSIGGALSHYLSAADVAHYFAPLADPDRIPDALVNLHRHREEPGTLLLVAHANPNGFKVPRTRSLFSWRAFASILNEYLPHVNELFLCGCEAGVHQTLQTIMETAPTIECVYGPQEKIRFPQAVYGFTGLLFHMGIRGLNVKEAVENVSRETGIEFAAAYRTYN